MPDAPGVVHALGPLPPVEPGPIASAIKQVTHEALRGLPPGAKGARIALSHDRGVELAFAHRTRDGHWTVDAWVGRGFAQSSTIEWSATAQVLW